MKSLRPGPKILLVFLFLAYLFPLVGNILLAGSLDSIYRIHPLGATALTALTVTLALFGFLTWRRFPNFSRLRLPRLERLARCVGGLYLRLRLPWLIVVLLLAAWTLWTGHTGYRYAAKGLSEQNSYLLLVMVGIGPLLTADVFYSLFVCRNDQARLPTRIGGDWLLALSLVLTANGTGAMFQALIAVSYAIWPGGLSRMFFLPRDLNFRSVLWRYGVMALYTASLFVASWMFGEILKSRKPGESFSTSVSKVSQQIRALAPASGTSHRTAWGARPTALDRVNRTALILRQYGCYLVERFSVYYYTFLFTTDPERDRSYEVKEWPLVYPLRTMLFRADFLLGRPFDLTKPKISSLMQLNYQALTAQPDRASRQGSSAGVLASFNYILPLPLAIVAAVGYLCLLAKIIDVLLDRHRNEVLSFFGAIFALPYLVLFVQSPLDLLLVFDDAVLYTVLILGIALACRSHQPAGSPSAA